jgi:glutamine synthetase
MEEASTVEFKAADTSCNPYLVVGGLIAAGLDGIERRLEPPEPVEVDPATIPEAERENAASVACRRASRRRSKRWRPTECSCLPSALSSRSPT